MTLQQKLAAARSATPGATPAPAKPRPAPSVPSLETPSRPATTRDKVAAARSGSPKPALPQSENQPPPVKPASATPALPLKPAETTPSRRRFLSLTTLLVGWAALAGIGAGIWAWSRRSRPAGGREILRTLAIGPPDDFRSGLVDSRWLDDGGFWVVRESSGGRDQIFALRATCTHLGCRPSWHADAREFLCPCHGSRFAPDGKPTAGPAPRSLDRYPITLGDDGQIHVTTEFTPGADPAPSLKL